MSCCDGTCSPECGRKVDEELENRYCYHAPKDVEQTQKYEQIRAECKNLAYTLKELVPNSRELSRALTCLDDVMFNANAGIARNE